MAKKVFVVIMLLSLIIVFFLIMVHFFNLGGFTGFILGLSMLTVTLFPCMYIIVYIKNTFDNGDNAAACIGTIILLAFGIYIVGSVFGWFDGRSSSSRNREDDGIITTTDDYGKADAWDFDKDGKLNQREMEQYSRAVQREYDANN